MDTLENSGVDHVVIRRVPASRGTAWLLDSYRVYLRHPWLWTFLIALASLISFGFGRLGFIGSLIQGTLSLFFGMGLALGVQSVQQGQKLEFETLFKSFQSKNLALIGVALFNYFWLYFSLAIGLLVFLGMVGTSVFSEFTKLGSLANSDSPNLGQLKESLMPLLGFFWPAWAAFWVAILVYVAGTMASLFAPFLIALKNVSFSKALRQSFRACGVNVWPLTVYGLILASYSLFVMVICFALLSKMIFALKDIDLTLFAKTDSTQITQTLAAVADPFQIILVAAFGIVAFLLIVPAVSFSFYFAYADIFDLKKEEINPSPKPLRPV